MARLTPTRIALALLAVAIGGAVVWSFWPSATPVETATAARDSFVVTVDEDGKTRVRERYVVASPLSGRTTRVVLHAGDHVQAGDVIASILPSPAPFLDPRARREAEERLGAAEAALERAKATVERANVVLEQADRDLARARALLERGVATVKAVEQAELAHHMADRDVSAANFQYEAARHALEQAKALLALYDRSPGTPPETFEVTAPVAGEIIHVLQESETIVEPGTPLVEIGDCCDLEIVVDVLSTDAVEIEKGDRVVIENWGGPKPLEGRVRLVEPGGFTKISTLGVEEQRVNVIVDIVSPREAWLDLGDAFQIDARIEVLTVDDALVVPSGALFRKEGAWHTYVVRDGRAELRPVDVLRRSGGLAAIAKGLEPGDQVIVYPSDSVAPSVRVKPR
jgi:HlyD family secretion protein